MGRTRCGPHLRAGVDRALLCARCPESVQSAGLEDDPREPHLTVAGDKAQGVKWPARGGAQHTCSGSPGVRHTYTHTRAHKHRDTHMQTRCVHTQAHTRTHTQTQTCVHAHTHVPWQCAPSHPHVHTCTGTGTLRRGPCHAPQSLALFGSNVLFAAFASPWPHRLQHLIRLCTGGRGHTLLKIIVIILANGVKWNFLPRGNPLI